MVDCSMLDCSLGSLPVGDQLVKSEYDAEVRVA